MFKNVASQKIALFAFDITTGAAKTGDAANITPYVNIDWAGVTALTDTSATELSSTNAPGWYLFDVTQAETNGNQLLFTAKSSTSNVSVVGQVVDTTPANFTLFSIDSNGRIDAIKVAGTTQTARDLGASVLLSPGTGTGQLDITSGVVKANATQILGTAVATPATAGVLDVNVKNMNNVAATSITAINANQGTTQPVNHTGTGGSALVKADTVSVDAGLPGTIADAVWDEDATAHQAQGSFGQAIGDPVADANTIFKAVVTDAAGATVGVDVVAVKAETASIQSDTNDIQARIPAALVGGRIDASVGGVATNAINAAGIASDVTTELRALASGTADSGTTTTMVDAARTEADTDYWKDMAILFTSGSISGQTRLITAFNPATDTITFSPATTQAVGTNTYEIIPNVAAAGASAPTAAEVADAVWDEATSGHVGAGSTGKVVSNISPSSDTIVIGTAATGTLSNTQMTTNLSGYANDQINGRFLIWRSGVLAGSAVSITDYASAGGLISFSGGTPTGAAPSNGDTFVIV